MITDIFLLPQSTFRSFSYAWLITGFITRVARRVPLVEQDWLPFLSTWVHPRFLMGSVGNVLKIVICPFSFVLCNGNRNLFFLSKASDDPFDIFKLFLHTYLLYVATFRNILLLRRKLNSQLNNFMTYHGVYNKSRSCYSYYKPRVKSWNCSIVNLLLLL